MNDDVNRAFFSHPSVVLEYARAAANIGIWNSERELCEKFIARNAEILELGAGAGRVSLGLAKLGYARLTITDFAAPMIEIAKIIFADARDVPAGTDLRFAVEDATKLSFPPESFDAAIFAFNGLQMIPKHTRRERAIAEIARVLRKGGIFIFTGHDRTHAARSAHWRRERESWENNTRDPELDDFGDYNHATPQGVMFIHAAEPAKIRAALQAAGFEILFSELRSRICSESAEVREFSDDTRFWVARKLR